MIGCAMEAHSKGLTVEKQFYPTRIRSPVQGLLVPRTQFAATGPHPIVLRSTSQ